MVRRNAGLTLPRGVPFYTVFHSEFDHHDLSFFETFLDHVIPTKTDEFFKDDKFYKKR